ncbi:hypothetical protein [Cupriavidus pauculus]|uniref:Porin family protein n=1 Tax=Cupriavidus pauculus TaxID=82633 RepID=A0A2N5CAR5_9BURK|nr:hypothetical protein [Cupriavidus pauculus]PLP99323.1 hypothetical protein CYJ10_18385 [Cupriavidus pauculus]
MTHPPGLGRQHLCVAILLAIATGSGHAESPDANGWKFAIAPYLWLPNVSGAFSFSGNASTGGGRLDMGTGPDSYLQNLQFLFMMQAEARKGDWAIIADAAYLDFSNQNTTLNTVGTGGGAVAIPRELATNTGSSLSGGVFGLAAAYTALRAAWGTVEPLGGVRYLNLSASANWTLSSTFVQQGATLATQGSVAQTANIVDGIIGVRGRIRLGNNERWYLPYYLDVGTGASRYTVQAFGGAAYAASWGDVQLTYRYLTYQLGGSDLVQRLTLKGPMLSVAFRF